MSNQPFRIAVATLCAAELAALIWALLPRGRRYGLYAVNTVSSALALLVLLPELPGEINSLMTVERGIGGVGLDDCKTSLLCAVEIVILVSAGLGLIARRVPRLLVWLGFTVNAALSALAFVYAFFVEFRCCGYL